MKKRDGDYRSQEGEGMFLKVVSHVWLLRKLRAREKVEKW
jgi:hypothetical protein